VAIRNMIYFAFAAYLVFMNNVSYLSFEDVFPIEFTDKKFLDITTFILKIFLIIWVAQYIIEASGHGYFDFDIYDRKSEFGGVSQMNFPIKAVDFLVENDIKGNIFNEFNSGAYLVGRCFPDIKVYIDGRTELYGPEFFKRYLKIVRDQDVTVLKEAIDTNQITIAFINTVRDEGPDKILKYFYEQKDWALVYLGYDGVIFLKDIPQHAEVIERCRIDLHRWEVAGLDAYRLGPRKVVPFQHVNRAYSLAAMGAEEAALGECDEALKIFPGYPEAFALMGQIYAERKDYEQAFHYFRLAVMYNSSNRQLRFHLAKTYEKLGKHNYALEQLEKIMDRFPQHPAAYFMAAHVLIEDAKPDRALGYAQQGFQLDKKAVKDIMELGDLCAEKGYDDASLRMYAIAKDADMHRDQVHLKVGDVLQKMGRMEEATTEWTSALEFSGNEARDLISNRLAVFGVH
ncbi:MAG TPA: tetratricopeptide repeat protein, partial [Candidatus Bathyarchaeia archaeon]|nr:tetratricopeptide repeat protein [Candidatus Bathyarchaeia archaeon]